MIIVDYHCIGNDQDNEINIAKIYLKKQKLVMMQLLIYETNRQEPLKFPFHLLLPSTF